MVVTYYILTWSLHMRWYYYLSLHLLHSSYVFLFPFNLPYYNSIDNYFPHLLTENLHYFLPLNRQNLLHQVQGSLHGIYVFPDF
jgi:hypothetical protein